MQARCMEMSEEGQKLCHNLNEYLKSSTSDAGDMLSFKTIFSKILHLHFCTKTRRQFSRMLGSSSRKKCCNNLTKYASLIIIGRLMNLQ